MIQSFFQKHFTPITHDPRNPDHLILDTSSTMRDLLSVIQTLPDCAWEQEEMVELVLGYITYEDRALQEMEYGCLDLVDHALGKAYEEHVVVLANAVVAFGRSIFDQLQRMRAYKNNYLHYQFGGWDGLDVILAKFNLRDVDTNL